ncbi:MAG: AtpZ/AtpI family protein [Candidatus Hydrogenedentota bacterium]
MPEEPPSQQSVLRALALVGQLGLVIAAPIVVSVIGGVYLDAWLKGRGIVLVVMIVLGVGGGIAGGYRLLAKEISWKR